MVYIEFVNGDKEFVEAKSEKDEPVIFDVRTSCFTVFALDGNYIYPRDFVKSIKYLFN